MASATMISAMVVVLLVLLQPMNVIGDVPSLLPPVIGDNICKSVDCGKGTCKASASSTFFFECNCDAGWKQTHSADLDKDYAFLPCVVPNCTLDYTCNNGPPAPPTEKPSNKSIIDPCYWVDCGVGTCKTASTAFAHKCECPEGYFNLFNTPSYPCMKECGIGGDCKSLGVDMKNTTNNPSNGSSMSRGSIGWTIISMLFFVPFLWK